MERSRLDKLESALTMLVTELETWDYTAQRDDSGEYGEDSVLGYAKKILLEGGK